MLVSHRKRFIFTKTAKTAGTSVESYFEPYCMPDGSWELSHSREETVSEAGIVGYRGPKPAGRTYYNHMPASAIRAAVGEDIWSRYCKFTVVRNPYDKLISGFVMFERMLWHETPLRRLRSRLLAAVGHGRPIDRARGDHEIERFRHWLRLGGTVHDRDKYWIDGEACVDVFIRFEHLNPDLERLCARLAIPFEPERMPEFKKGGRVGKPKVRDYYDDETRRIVEREFAWEIERFGYTMPED